MIEIAGHAEQVETLPPDFIKSTSVQALNKTIKLTTYIKH